MVSIKFGIDKSIRFGIGKIWFWKKVSDSVSFRFWVSSHTLGKLFFPAKWSFTFFERRVRGIFYSYCWILVGLGFIRRDMWCDPPLLNMRRNQSHIIERSTTTPLRSSAGRVQNTTEIQNAPHNTFPQLVQS